MEQVRPICTPTIVTAAMFVALLFLDLFRMETRYMLGHLVLGVFSVLAVSVLCQNNAEFAAWVLLLIPFGVLLFGWIFMQGDELKRKRAAAAVRPAPTEITRGSPYCQCGGKLRYNPPCCVNPAQLESA